MAKTSKKPSYAPEMPERPKTKKSANSKKITVKSSNAKTKRKAAPVYEEDEEIIEVEVPKRGRIAKKTAETTKEAVRTNADEEAQKNASQPTSTKRNLSIPYYERYLMTVEETSAYFHIGSKKMSSIINVNPKAKWLLLSGNRRMIKRALFAQWIDEQQEI